MAISKDKAAICCSARRKIDVILQMNLPEAITKL